MDDDVSWEDYDSGPFCTHWGDFDCDCVCGHKCGRHDDIGAGSCEECECEVFRDIGESLKSRAESTF